MENLGEVGRWKPTGRPTCSTYAPWTRDMSMKQFQQLSPHGVCQILEQIKVEMEKVLGELDVNPKEVRWDVARWGMADVTGSWQTPDASRNLHAWIEGDWPAIRVGVEGNAWKDNENELSRRAVQCDGDQLFVTLKGSAHDPRLGPGEETHFTLPPAGEGDVVAALSEALRATLEEVKRVDLSSNRKARDYPLQPKGQL